ncbi:hypothetical protein Mal15_26880 [Stieleria maiorica]|uniref:Uncharacterized protein n=1 Tax=Stieleria maiorica TaxID=2795974 RepID=A0A5B9MCX0_9BACT|nr:hypothetical protein [Stieleria maiorica]QEF98633.1 hypothetical protein Mal15_26880 [Stieleria maiorica]
MTSTHHSSRHTQAAASLDQVTGTGQGIGIVESLSIGLNTVRDLVFHRIHLDVERYFGMDSMSIPISLDQSEYNAKAEIDIWQIIEAADFAGNAGFVADHNWVRGWLGELRLGGSFGNGPISQRVNEYAQQDEDGRRRHFASCLERVYPEARKCPLVLYQLMPSAVRIVVAVAFGATQLAAKERDRQTFLLPGISDCASCKAGVLDNGETCVDCGNPIWNYNWLLADD